MDVEIYNEILERSDVRMIKSDRVISYGAWIVLGVVMG